MMLNIRIHDTCHKFKSCLWYSSSLYKQSYNQNGITNNSFSRYELNGNQFDFKFKFMWTILAMLPNLVLSTFYKKLSLSILFYYCKGVLHLIPEGSIVTSIYLSDKHYIRYSCRLGSNLWPSPWEVDTLYNRY